jgi:hypothetical protein
MSSLKHEPLGEILKRKYGYDISPNTKHRWISGRLKDGRVLKHIRLGNKILCTEEDVVAFLECESETLDKPAAHPKSRSEIARAKAVAQANAELEAAGVK